MSKLLRKIEAKQAIARPKRGTAVYATQACMHGPMNGSSTMSGTAALRCNTCVEVSSLP